MTTSPGVSSPSVVSTIAPDILSPVCEIRNALKGPVEKVGTAKDYNTSPWNQPRVDTGQCDRATDRKRGKHGSRRVGATRDGLVTARYRLVLTRDDPLSTRDRA